MNFQVARSTEEEKLDIKMMMFAPFSPLIAVCKTKTENDSLKFLFAGVEVDITKVSRVPATAHHC